MVLALALLLLQPDAFSIHAELTSQSLSAGARGELSVSFELTEGWAAAPNPLLPDLAPAAMLQLLAPPGIELDGEPVVGLRALLRHGFLDLPHESLLERGTTTIGFRVVDPLPEDAVLAFNVLTYAAPEEGQDLRPRLIRRRYRLSLLPGARATLASDGASC